MVMCCLLLTLFMLLFYSWRTFFLLHLLICVFCLCMNISLLHVSLCLLVPTCWLTSEGSFLTMKCLLSDFYSLMMCIEPLHLSIYFKNPKPCSLSPQQLLSVSNIFLWLLVMPKSNIIDVYFLFINNG